jgi:DNA helicase HerA-like ATPase
MQSQSIRKSKQEEPQLDLSSIRIREHFGLISNDSHTEKFTFLVSPPKSRAGLEKNDYILVDHPLVGEACQVLATIVDIASYEEIAGSTINEKKAKMLATAQVIGGIDMRKDNKPLSKVLVPPNPGSRVYIPLKVFLEDVLNRNLKGETYKTPLQIGTFEGLSAEEKQGNGEIKCSIDAQELTGKHTLISAVAGAGKTYLTKKIVSAIQEKTSSQLVIFDAYGEYMEAANCIPITAKIDKETLLKDIRKGKVVSLNGSGLSLDEKRLLFIDALKSLIKLRLEDKIAPLMVVIEEAENLKSATLDEAVAMGRKIGLLLCLLTTHPFELGGKILSAMGNEIVGRTTYKNDIECLANFSATYQLTSLAVGEWILNGIATARPVKMRVE